MFTAISNNYIVILLWSKCSHSEMLKIEFRKFQIQKHRNLIVFSQITVFS